MDKSKLKIVLIHGNGGGTASDHWFPQLAKSLKNLGLDFIAKDFPDNQVAHESIWIPFLKNEIKADKNTFLVGHSSGGVAALRFAEENKIFGSALVGVNHTDLGDATEKESGYYNRPWDWDRIKNNQNWIIQFASTDDPYIPTAEPRFIHEQLGSDYYEFSDRGHFMTADFPEIFLRIKEKVFA